MLDRCSQEQLFPDSGQQEQGSLAALGTGGSAHGSYFQSCLASSCGISALPRAGTSRGQGWAGLGAGALGCSRVPGDGAGGCRSHGAVLGEDQMRGDDEQSPPEHSWEGDRCAGKMKGCFCRGFSPKTRAKLLNQVVIVPFS